MRALVVHEPLGVSLRRADLGPPRVSIAPFLDRLVGITMMDPTPGEADMRYTLLLHYMEMTEEQLGEEGFEAGKAAFHSYAEALDRAGVLVSAEVLQPSSSSTTVRLRDGAVQVQDGPFADTKEQLAGTFVIDVWDLDAALGWAAKCPAADWGAVEVRPTFTRYTEGRWTPSV